MSLWNSDLCGLLLYEFAPSDLMGDPPSLNISLSHVLYHSERLHDEPLEL